MFATRPPDGYCHGNEIAARLQTAVDEDVTDDEVFYPEAMTNRDGT